MFKAPAIHIPIGQRSDAAHLENERIRLENLTKGKDVLRQFLLKISYRARSSTTATATTTTPTHISNAVE